MNQNSSAPDAGPSATALSNGTDVTALLTNVHLIWLVVFAVLVIAAIVYGSRLKRKRRRAERQVARNAEAAGVAPAAPAAADPAPAEPAAEPIAAAAPAAPAPTAAAGAGDGSVTQLKGLGPKVAARLAELGITTVGQIAALDHDAAARLDAQLGAFAGRMERDRWIEQARFLSAGDRAGFEAVFGRL